VFPNAVLGATIRGPRAGLSRGVRVSSAIWSGCASNLSSHSRSAIRLHTPALAHRVANLAHCVARSLCANVLCRFSSLQTRARVLQTQLGFRRKTRLKPNSESRGEASGVLPHAYVRWTNFTLPVDFSTARHDNRKRVCFAGAGGTKSAGGGRQYPVPKQHEAAGTRRLNYADNEILASQRRESCASNEGPPFRLHDRRLRGCGCQSGVVGDSSPRTRRRSDSPLTCRPGGDLSAPYL
jgi:hypothetical protein